MLLIQPTSSSCRAAPRFCSSGQHRHRPGFASTRHVRLRLRPCKATGDQPKQQDEQQEGCRSTGDQPKQPTYPPGYDPAAAAGFMPSPGEQPLWWVKKFESMRLKLAQEQAAAAAASVVATAAAAGDGSSGSGASASAASDQAQAIQTTGTSALPTAGNSNDDNDDKAPAPPLTPQLLRSAVLQVLQLLLVIAALILWPASLYPGALAAPRTWLLFGCYMCFFAGGSVFRLLRYGPLAARQRDAQGKTWGSRAAWTLFVGSIPVIHFPPMRECFSPAAAAIRSSTSSGGLSLYDVLGGVMLAAALALNWSAARALGRAYDRVVTPERLITSGPFALIQHPIYTSYMLLFAGYAMMLHSGQTALWAVAVCLIYYRSRAKLEAALLEDAFGPEYQAYRKRTRLFVPFLM